MRRGKNLPNIFFLWRKEIKSNHTSENFVLMRRMKKQQIQTNFGRIEAVLFRSLQKKVKKNKQECMQFLEDINTSILTEEKQKQCEGKLTLKEIWDSLASMKNGKTPGNDGLTKEFYLAFFGELGRLTVTTFN